MARNAPFVGRERELAALGEIRKETSQGPRFVLVGGEAGVGKSRLLAEFRRSLPRRSAVFGEGECADVAPAPFAPFIAMFTPIAPEIARRLSVAPPIGTHGEAAVRELFDDVRRALEAFAAKRAVLLYLEDVHFADRGTLALLAHLARACRGPRLLAIATYRVEALTRSDELVATLARLVRLPNVVTVDLNPLARRDALALAAGTIGADLAADAQLATHWSRAPTATRSSSKSSSSTQPRRAATPVRRCRARSPPRSANAWQRCRTTIARCWSTRRSSAVSFTSSSFERP
jgi:predicted ATPase